MLINRFGEPMIRDPLGTVCAVQDIESGSIVRDIFYCRCRALVDTEPTTAAASMLLDDIDDDFERRISRDMPEISEDMRVARTVDRPPPGWSRCRGRAKGDGLPMTPERLAFLRELGIRLAPELARLYVINCPEDLPAPDGVKAYVSVDGDAALKSHLKSINQWVGPGSVVCFVDQQMSEVEESLIFVHELRARPDSR